MSCNPEMLKSVPLFSLLDDETAVFAAQVDVKEFALSVIMLWDCRMVSCVARTLGEC